MGQVKKERKATEKEKDQKKEIRYEVGICTSQKVGFKLPTKNRKRMTVNDIFQEDSSTAAAVEWSVIHGYQPGIEQISSLQEAANQAE